MTAIKTNNSKLEIILIYLIPLNFVFDSLTIIVFEAGSLFSLLRGIILYTIIIITYSKFSISKREIFIYLFLLQTLALLPFSNNIYTSINISSKVFASLLMFPVGFYLIKNEYYLSKIINQIPVLLIIIIINFVLGRYFGIGYDVYDKNESLKLGNFSDNVNVFTYTLLVVPLYFINSKSKFSKILVILMSCIVCIIILLAMKRIAIIGVILGFLIFSYFTGNFLKNIKWLIILLSLLLLLRPLYQDLLQKRYLAREDELQIESFEEEGRFKETQYIWSEILSFKNPVRSIFGYQTFNSPDNYGGMFNPGRRLHVDYNEIVFGNGLLGILLYMAIYFNIARYFLRYKLNSNNIKYSIYKGVFWSLLLTSIFTSFSGQYYAITFRTIIFFFLGAILRFFYNQYKKFKTNRILTHNSIQYNSL